MSSRSLLHKVIVGLFVAGSSLCANAYRAAGTSTEPNVWTRNYSGVLAAAQQTGYPILIVVVNSATCGHCHLLNQLTLNSTSFAQMENELTFYKLMMDEPNGGDFRTVATRYYRYFESGMYPIIGVLRSNGDMYGSFGNRTTDSRDVSMDIRQLIESLAVEQGADIWSGSGVEPFSVVPVIEPYKMTVQDWAAKLKGKINGVAFDSNQEVAASFTIGINISGKATVKFVSSSGRTSEKGVLSLEEEVLQIRGDSLFLTYDESSKTWSGKWGEDHAVYASSLPSSAYSGVYTSSATNATASGFASVALKNGKGKLSGMFGGKNKLSASGAAVVLPAEVVSAQLHRWASGHDVAFVPVVKAGKYTGGYAVYADGAVSVSIGAFGANWTGSGAIWLGDDLSPLAGKVLRFADVEIPIKVVSAKKIAAGDNDVSARLSVTAKNGTFKGSAKLPEGVCRFEGVLLRDGTSVHGVGTSYGVGVYRVEIGDAK